MADPITIPFNATFDLSIQGAPLSTDENRHQRIHIGSVTITQQNGPNGQVFARFNLDRWLEVLVSRQLGLNLVAIKYDRNGNTGNMRQQRVERQARRSESEPEQYVSHDDDYMDGSGI